MKTLTERVDDLLFGIIYQYIRTEIGIDGVKTLVRRALKEQDKITRHACAENLIELETHQEHAISDPLISLDKAHNIIMNTRAV